MKTNHIDDEPLFESLDAMIAHQRQANRQHAEMVAEQAVQRLEREIGLQARPGLVEAVAWQLLQILDERLDRNAESIAVAMGHEVLH